MREALKWIAEQGCEGDGNYERCRDLPNNPCISEYCLPCFAAEALEQDDRDAEWEKRSEGLDDNYISEPNLEQAAKSWNS